MLQANADIPDTYPQPQNDGASLQPSGSGEDSTTTAFADFVGGADVAIDLSAMVDAIYNSGQVGNTAGLSASGNVALNYEFHETGGPPPSNVPIPAAAGMGLALLGGLTLRRRRSSGAAREARFAMSRVRQRAIRNGPRARASGGWEDEGASSGPIILPPSPAALMPARGACGTQPLTARAALEECAY